MPFAVAPLLHTEAFPYGKSKTSEASSGSTGPSRRYRKHLEAKKTANAPVVSDATSRPISMALTPFRDAAQVERVAPNGRTVRAPLPLPAAGLSGHIAELERALDGAMFARRANREARAAISKRLLFARSRATNRDRACTLTLDGLCEIFTAQGGLCAVTGLPMDIGDAGGRDGRWRKPFRLSIDRIDSAGGYTPENVRLVCAAVNNALGPWGEAVFAIIAQAFMTKARNG